MGLFNEIGDVLGVSRRKRGVFGNGRGDPARMAEIERAIAEAEGGEAMPYREVSPQENAQTYGNTVRRYVPTDEAGAVPSASGMFGGEKKKRGFFGHGVGKVLREFAHSAPSIQATLAGDYEGAARLDALHDKGHASKEAAKAMAAQQQQAYQVLVERGMDPRMAAITVANALDKLGEEWATSQRTREGAKGHSIFSPNATGGYDIVTAPDDYQHQADVVRTPPQFSQAGPGVDPTQQPGFGNVRLRTADEQYADNIAERGSPEWNNAYQDSGVGAYGPTAQKMNTQRITATNERAAANRAAADARAAAARAAADRRSAAGRTATDRRAAANRDARAATQFPEGTVVEWPDGSTKVRKNGRWVNQ